MGDFVHHVLLPFLAGMQRARTAVNSIGYIRPPGRRNVCDTAPLLPDSGVITCARQDDEKAVKAFGVEYGVQVCQDVMAAGAPGVHFYTLNLEKVSVGLVWVRHTLTLEKTLAWLDPRGVYTALPEMRVSSVLY